MFVPTPFVFPEPPPSRCSPPYVCTSKSGYSHFLDCVGQTHVCPKSLSPGRRFDCCLLSLCSISVSSLSPSRRNARRTTLPPTLLNSSRLGCQSPSQNGSSMRKCCSLLEQ